LNLLTQPTRAERQRNQPHAGAERPHQNYGRTWRFEGALELWGKFLQLRLRGPETLENPAWNLMYPGGVAVL